MHKSRRTEKRNKALHKHAESLGAAPPTKKANTHSKAAQHAANKAAHARATKRVHELSKKAGIKVRSAVPKKAADAAYDKYQLHERQQKRKHMFPPVKTKEQAVKRAYEVMHKSRRTEKRNKALHKHAESLGAAPPTKKRIPTQKQRSTPPTRPLMQGPRRGCMSSARRLALRCDRLCRRKQRMQHTISTSCTRGNKSASICFLL